MYQDPTTRLNANPNPDSGLNATPTVARQRKIPQKSSNIAVDKNYLQQGIRAEL